MIIVTGGAGFIGSNLVRGLNRRGITEVLVVDDLEDGSKHLNLNALEVIDVVDYRDFERDLEGLAGAPLEAVFHQGACSDTMERDGRFMLDVNHRYSKRLLELSLGRCPFIYASSASVYGDGDDGFREQAECEYPLNVYAYSKLLFDRHVRRVLPAAKTQVVGLRYFNVYGPQEAHKGRMASVIFKLNEQVRSQGRLEVFEGSSDFRRDFVFVDDAVDVNLFFLDHPGESGVFNCGTGRARSFMELAEEVSRHLDGAPVVEVPFPPELLGKYQRFTQADLTLLRRAGYEADFTSLEDGVAAYVGVLKETGGHYRRPARA